MFINVLVYTLYSLRIGGRGKPHSSEVTNLPSFIQNVIRTDNVMVSP